ncbi:glycosyltransferase family 2 protein [Pseudidiomarina sp. YC-516-91]|uniref:glycosyltransferase family 2 protein n=1 Tax=Pseudidiomarina salilacus TaxID=3384452 RepID=UPI0039849B70
MKDFGLITVAIPFYNPGKHILAAVESVLAQTYENFELLLIDDGSTDGSMELTNKFNDSRIKRFSDGRNLGLAARLNQSVAMSKGVFYARMDADDIILPEKFEKQVEVLGFNSKIDLTSCGVILLNNDNSVVGVRKGQKPPNVIPDDAFLTGTFGITHAAVMGRIEWFKRNPYNETFKCAQDIELWTRTLLANDLSIKILRKPLYIYRDEGNVKPVKLNRVFNAKYRIAKMYFGYSKRVYFGMRWILYSVITYTFSAFGLTHLLYSKRSSTASSPSSETVARVEHALKVYESE